LAMPCHTSALVLVEATREHAGPAQHAVVEMGAPPLGLPALVDRRREHQVTGGRARTESRSLVTSGPHAPGRRQTDRGSVPQRRKNGGKKNVRKGA